MKKNGYLYASLWECSNKYICTISLDNSSTLLDLIESYRDSPSRKFLDVALFHKSDSDIASKVSDIERQAINSMK